MQRSSNSWPGEERNVYGMSMWFMKMTQMKTWLVACWTSSSHIRGKVLGANYEGQIPKYFLMHCILWLFLRMYFNVMETFWKLLHNVYVIFELHDVLKILCFHLTGQEYML